MTFVISWTASGLITVWVQGASEPFLVWQMDEAFPIRYFGLKTDWGATGEWKIDGVRHVATPDTKEYTWFPVHHGRLNFAVRAPNDAHIGLFGGASEETPMYEVFIGGWNNTKSAIRLNKEKPDVAEHEAASILSNDESRQFWIAMSYAGVQVGRAGDPQPFMTHTHADPFVVTHYGIRTHWEAQGEWDIDIEDGTAPIAPSGGVQWVPASGGSVPEGAFVGGEDNGAKVYVTRASHEGALLPGKLVEGHACAYVPWGGEEHSKEQYEVLVVPAGSVSWVDAAGDAVPPKAINAGNSEANEPLYIGRATHEDQPTVGKYHPANGSVYVSYGGKEIPYAEFQVLVLN
jgi:hypothetical protein